MDLKKIVKYGIIILILFIICFIVWKIWQLMYCPEYINCMPIDGCNIYKRILCNEHSKIIW